MDWFKRITGFSERDYAGTQAKLSVVDGVWLVSQANGVRHGIGQLEMPTLAELRRRVASLASSGKSTSVKPLVGDVQALHSEAEFEGALFQVASQFNLLEMVSPEVTPEDGVTRYQFDRTQGPACARAAGAATIYRNYLAPVGEQRGQTAARQLDALVPLGAALAAELGCTVPELWEMRNGYALATSAGLDAIAGLLKTADEGLLDELRGRLCIGLHRDVEVTDAQGPQRPRVSQAFCSALPVCYSRIPRPRWELFARLVLEAAYEATLLAAQIQFARGGSPAVLLTRLGGGAFGNDPAWIDDAIQHALPKVEHVGLDVRLVRYG
jgi:hypothetical protein